MRVLFYGHLILLAILAALGGALVYYGEPTRVQQQILSELEKGSGYRVTAAGTPTLVYTPNIALELNDVMFHEEGAQGSDPVLRAARVKAVVGWIPLFTQWKVDLKRVEVSEPKVSLAIDSSGANQLESLLPTSVFEPPAIDVGEIVIQNAALTYKDKKTNTSYNVKSLNARTKALKFDKPTDATFDFVFNGQKFSGQTTVGNLTDLLSKKAAPVTLDATGDDANLKFEGTLQVPDGLVSGKVDAKAGSLESLSALLGAEPQDGSVKGAIALKGDVEFTAGTINLRQAEINIGGSRFVGDIAFNRDGGVTVSNGLVKITGVDALPDLELTKVDLRSSSSSLASPISTDFSFVHRGQKVKGSLTAAEPQALLDGLLAPLKVSASSEVVQVTFDGKADTKTSSMKGQATLKADSVTSLVKWLDLKRPDALKFKSIDFKGGVDLSGNNVSFENATFKVDDIAANGTLSIDTAKDRPVVSGDLKLDKIDIARFTGTTDGDQLERAPASGTAEDFEFQVVDVKESLQAYIDEDPNTAVLEARTSSRKSVWSKEEIDFSGLGSADADLKLGISQLSFGAKRIGPAVLAIALNNKTLNLNITELGAYAGSITGRIDLDAQPNIPTVKADLTLAGVDIVKAAKDFGAKKHLTGKASGTIKLSTSGKSQHDFVNALSGDVSTKISDGAIIGYDIRRVLRSIFSLLGGLKFNPSHKTSFDALTADLGLKKGIARNSKIKLKGSGLGFSARGFLNLVSQQVGYRGRVTRTPRPPGLSLPLRFSGPLLKPKTAFDAGAFFGSHTETVSRRTGDQQQLESLPPPLDLGDPALEALVARALRKSGAAGTLSEEGRRILGATTSD